ncbi:MAG TPA: hypothetical protein PLA74_03090 [Syntrophales bacterium]|nr:hypothetical protein [Syntrophales bacterium]HPQ43130.1 hypothetical protein [Syntrophales bacterium]
MTTKEIQSKLIETMREWQKIENASVSSTGQVIEKTDNSIIRLIMEIIQRDSQTHYRIQEFITESLESKAVSLEPQELAGVWNMIERHIKLEKRTVELANEAKVALQGKKMVVQEYLIDYLLVDEEKHNHILENLSTIKKGMYPYG